MTHLLDLVHVCLHLFDFLMIAFVCWVFGPYSVNQIRRALERGQQ